MNSERNVAEKTRTPGVIETALENEITAGLARLQISREELFAEGELYPSTVEEYPEVYEPFPLSVAFRARAIELLSALAHDGLGTNIKQLDKWIAELREVLPGAAGRPSPALAAKFKEIQKAIEAADKAFYESLRAA